MMVTIDNWRYLARYMKMLGYSASAIQGTLALLGHERTVRAIRDCTNIRNYSEPEYMPPGYQEYHDSYLYSLPASIALPVGLDEVAGWLLDINGSETYSEKPQVSGGGLPDSPEKGVIYRRMFSPEDDSDHVSLAYETGIFMEDATDSEHLPSDSFSFWADDNHKSGLARYLDYERRSNKSESELPEYDA